MPTTCLTCGAVVARAVQGRCRRCYLAGQRKRNALPYRAAYRRPEYRSQVMGGLCHICGEYGADTRDHVVPLSDDIYSTFVLPAHRACNSSRGAT